MINHPLFEKYQNINKATSNNVERFAQYHELPPRRSLQCTHGKSA
jgi:hypothetical protein